MGNRTTDNRGNENRSTNERKQPDVLVHQTTEVVAQDTDGFVSEQQVNPKSWLILTY